jgi:endonuclease/exonuclease/phosphatase family metal-dependent hydrolase
MSNAKTDQKKPQSPAPLQKTAQLDRETALVSLNELATEWSKYNSPAGKDKPQSTETPEQMHARLAVTDAFILGTLNPDVALMQEISLLRDKLMEARLSKEYHIFIAHNHTADGKENYAGGCAVLLRKEAGWEAEKTRGYPLVFKNQKTGDNKRRVALVVVTQRDGRETAFVSVHLEGYPSTTGDSLRLAQVMEAYEFARSKSPNGRIVLSGDFNQSLETMERITKALREKGMFMVNNKSITFPEKDQVIDFMFISDEVMVQNALHRVYPPCRTSVMPLAPYEWAAWGSDHCALIVYVRGL